jgi:hypothetical protein
MYLFCKKIFLAIRRLFKKEDFNFEEPQYRRSKTSDIYFSKLH